MVLFITGSANSGLVAQTYPEVTIPNTELRPLQSKILGQELNLYIKLTASYRVDEQRIYSVMYAIDANRSFAMLSINEIIPFAESNYRISGTDRALGGYSYGGLF